ncbi:MAG: hypothetical protein AAF950_16125 [Pseudomonadota bacterium]
MDAAIFCYLMSIAQQRSILFAPFEDQDFDFVTSWVEGDSRHYCPVQLKEVVPETLNPTHFLEAVIGKLHKYVDSNELTVAIKLNRITRFEPADVVLPTSVELAGLWIFGATKPDQSQWGLWGNFMNNSTCGGLAINYP